MPLVPRVAATLLIGYLYGSMVAPAVGLADSQWPGDEWSAACVPKSQCCKVCDKGKACGDSCISRDKQCHKGRGCACNVSELCRSSAAMAGEGNGRDGAWWRQSAPAYPELSGARHPRCLRPSLTARRDGGEVR